MNIHNPMCEKYELVKEYYYRFDNIDVTITGRIYRIILGADAEYTWEVSHYCRLSEEAEPYSPGSPFGNSIDQIERALDNYVRRFEKAVDWKLNDNF